MRKIEGVALRNDILSRVVSLKKLLSSSEEQLPLEYKKRIKKTKDRVSEILKDFQLDEARMNQEIAHIADKSDVTEEIIRLKSHFSQFEKILKKSKPAGRSLNFLLQEISREINTIGSKANNSEILRPPAYKSSNPARICRACVSGRCALASIRIITSSSDKLFGKL